jgi:cell division protein FtsI/penicillin-binding protein 2
VQATYEPGSTFKLVTLSAALENQAVRLGERIDCGHGSMVVSGARITDHEPFDLLTPLEILSHSSNVGAAIIGTRLRPETFHRHIRALGFGRPTGIELPGETPGLLRPVRDWSGLSRPMLAMGYEVAVTPLQLAAMVAAVANGGTLVKPRLVMRVEEHDGRLQRDHPPAAAGRVLSPATTRTLLAMMEEVVRDGTAKAAAIDGLTIAGKTGTAKKLVAGAYTSGHYVSSFVAVAPSRDPRLVLLVAIDEPRASAYYGGLVAAPVASRILSQSLVVLGVPAEGRLVEQRLYDFFPDVAGAAPPTVPARAIARR